MSHSIQISDELWDAYDGSPSKMRDTLWQVAAARSTRKDSETPDRALEREQAEAVGTIITLQWATNCNGEHRRVLFAGEQAMIRTTNGTKQIHCLDCVREMVSQ